MKEWVAKPSPEEVQKYYSVFAGEATMDVRCQQCFKPFTVRITYINYAPNEAGQFAGYPLFQEHLPAANICPNCSKSLQSEYD